MRFVLREGPGPIARADVAMLAAIGLPGGGIVAVGDTHVRVVPAEVAVPNELQISTDAVVNGAGAFGSTAEATRAVVPTAVSVTLMDGDEPIDAVPRELLTLPVQVGDRLTIGERSLRVADVHPGPCSILGSSTVAISSPVTGARPPQAPTAARSTIIAGLDNELELLTGWLRLLTGPPQSGPEDAVAGVVISGPTGSGRSELVAAAAASLDLPVSEIDLRTVTTPERLLASFERAVRGAPPRGVLFVDHLDPLLAREGGTRHQAAAVTRWLLDAVASTPGLAVVIASTRPAITDDLDAHDLLRRTLEIAPPNHARRRELLRASLPHASDADLDILANATPGFSALDISTAVLDARARSTSAPTIETLLEAIHATPASLGTTTLGSVPSYGFDRVANLADVKAALTESVIWPLTDPSRFARMGIEPPRGLLLYGPPGTGKTFVVRALAHESGAAFFAVKGAELLDKWVGESERGVREVFARARSVAPAIIFFDELDALAPVRGSSTNSVTDSVVAALLTEMDGVSSRGDVFVIGATNRRDLIDPALLRPGRLEVHLLLDLPGPQARAAFFDMTSVPLADAVDRDRLVEQTDGMSFADLDGILRRAAIAAMRKDPRAETVTWDDLEAALRV
jgi:SpoVK/Ycf46/Vps4 family AAA+-type ATPase